MYELPFVMHLRFWFYINVLPVMEQVALYLMLLSGVILLVWCVIRIISYQANKLPEEGVEREVKMRQKRAKKDKGVDQKTGEIDAYSSLLILDDANLTSITV